jgi:hypothetical protein
MKTLIRRALVVTTIGSGAVYAGLTGLTYASAQTNSPSPTAIAAKSASTATSSAQKSNSDHNCPKDGTSNSRSTSS